MTEDGRSSASTAVANASSTGAKKATRSNPTAKKTARSQNPRAQRAAVEYHDLTTFQRNALFKLMSKAGVSPADFVWRRRNFPHSSGVAASFPTLEHRADPDQFFAVGVLSRDYVGYYAPATHDPWVKFEENTTFSEGWSEVEEHFTQDWLVAVREQAKGDLWSQLEEQRAMFTAAFPAADNTPFSDAEQKRLHASIDDLLAQVKEQKLFQRDQFARLEAAMLYQKKAVGWLGRVDWLNGFMGAVLGQLLTVVSDPANVQQFLTLAVGAVAWLNAHVPQLTSG